MNKIVVTTDFSANSKRGIHFAMQLASQSQCELIFYNVVEIFRPSIWDQVYYGEFEINELKRNQKTLEKFIHTIYQKSNIAKTPYKCVCQVGISASNQIIEYAKESNANYVCVSNIGAGKLIQLFGTTASELIAFCPVPIFIIPRNYKSKPITNVCFASDFVNFREELSKVQQFTTSIKAKINILYFDYLVHLKEKKMKLNKLMTKYETKNIQFHFNELDPLYPLTDHIRRYVLKTKPSLLVSFTKQNRNWFNRLFLASKTAGMAYDTKTPMLVFRKKIK